MQPKPLFLAISLLFVIQGHAGIWVLSKCTPKVADGAKSCVLQVRILEDSQVTPQTKMKDGQMITVGVPNESSTPTPTKIARDDKYVFDMSVNKFIEMELPNCEQFRGLLESRNFVTTDPLALVIIETPDERYYTSNVIPYTAGMFEKNTFLTMGIVNSMTTDPNVYWGKIALVNYQSTHANMKKANYLANASKNIEQGVVILNQYHITENQDTYLYLINMALPQNQQEFYVSNSQATSIGANNAVMLERSNTNDANKKKNLKITLTKYEEKVLAKFVVKRILI